MNVYVLQVMSILEQSYCSPKYLYYLIPGQARKVRKAEGAQSRVIVRDSGHFEKLWHSSIAAIEKAVALLQHPQGYGAVAPSFFPYVSILPAFAALQTVAKRLSEDLQLSAQKKIRYWYWASVFMNRYSGAVESTSARDYLDVKAWFDDDVMEPGLIAEFRNRFRDLDLQQQTRRGSAIYNGVFCLLVLKGARDWVSGLAITPIDIDDHHVVPKSWGKQNGLGDLIDSVLNRVPLSSKTNRQVIGDRLPNQYLPRLFQNNDRKQVLEVMDSHLISAKAVGILEREPFGAADFKEFLRERQTTVTAAIESLLIKERLMLSPRLRELDERIEAVELSLRNLIAVRLSDDATVLPEHVQSMIQQRLRQNVWKNPLADQDRYRGLTGQLEFADLRELQAIVTHRTLWGLFQEDFLNKHTLEGKFGQLAELRNCIRHSRPANEVVRKEGEASVIWFERTLRRQV